MENKNIVFFIGKEKYTTDKDKLTVREILTQFAEEDPNETKLVLRKGKDHHEYSDLDEVIELKNGMKFILFDKQPTPVS